MPRCRAALVLGAVLAVAWWPVQAGDEAFQQAFVMLKAGQPQEALQRVDALLAQGASSARLLELKGRVLHALGRYEEAETFYFQALEKEPGLESSHFHLGEAAFRRAAWADALQYYGVFLRHQSKSRAAALKMVYCYVAADNLTDAAVWLQALDPSDEDEPTYYFARAALALASGKGPAALETLAQARTLYGNDAYARYEADFIFLRSRLPRPTDQKK
jgi:tetratricopeptide (TPR) repeat protein